MEVKDNDCKAYGRKVKEGSVNSFGSGGRMFDSVNNEMSCEAVILQSMNQEIFWESVLNERNLNTGKKRHDGDGYSIRCRF